MERNDRWLSIALRGALLLAFFWMVRDELVPLALGALFALLLDPLHRRLQRRLGKRARYAALLVTLAVVFGVVIPFVLIAARVVVSMNEFLTRGLPDVLAKLTTFWTDNLASVAHRLPLPVTSLQETATSLAQKLGGAVAATAGGFATALPGQVVSLFLFLLALYYFLRDGGRLVRWLMSLSPFEPEETDALVASIRETVHGSIFGQLATSAVQGGLTMLALWLLGVPGVLLFGILAMLLSVLPLVGTTPVTVGATVYLFAAGRPWHALIMSVAAVVIGVSDNIVRPWVQSARTQMHPLVTLAAIFGGIDVFGAAGVFIGPVVAAMAIWALDFYTRFHRGRRSREVPPPTGGEPR